MRKPALLRGLIGAMLLIGLPWIWMTGGTLAADRIRGAGLALIWCKTCHVIDDRGTGPLIGEVPSFPTIARNSEVRNEDIYVRLSESHVRMPQMALSHRDKEDLIYYIRSLAR